MYETKPYFYGTGRRKDSVARVRVYTGTGKITINDRDIDNYFGLETLKLIVRSPLVLLGLEGKYDVVVRVSGGGVSGQAGAIRHGLSRALLQQNEENRPVLKKAGFLTRDPRMKERKKYGLKAARRAPQFSKRLLYFRCIFYGSASAEPFFIAVCFPENWGARHPASAAQLSAPQFSKCNGDDRRLRRKQGGAVGAAASRTRAPLKVRSGCWEPQPGGTFPTALLRQGRFCCIRQNIF